MRMFLALLALTLAPAASAAVPCPPLLDMDLRPLAETQPVSLCREYRGKVLLVVNTASRCAYTDQYDGLEKLYARYRDRGLAVLGFPSNDFAGQEPGTESEIRDFCRLTYGVRFPMFQKTRVIEPSPHPFYRLLAEQAGEYPRWNFHKYLVSRDGRVVASFPSRVVPEDQTLVRAIENELATRETR